MSESHDEAEKAARPRRLQRNDKIAIGASLACLAAMIAAVLALGRRSEVWLVNGLDVPVDVEVDGASTHVEATGRVAQRLGSGVHEIRVLGASGEAFDEGPFEVTAGQDAVLYNVLGAAPLYFMKAMYSSGPGGGDGKVEFSGGSRSVVREQADFVFAELPTSITFSSGERRFRTKVDVAEGGWLTTLGYLDDHGELGRAGEIARAVARAEPGNLEAIGYACHLTEMAYGPDGVIRFLRGELARRPDDSDLHLRYMSALQRSGRAEQARNEYVKRGEAGPDGGALLLWALDLDRAAALAGKLLASRPDDALVRRGAARTAFFQEDWTAAAEHYSKIRSDPSYRWLLDYHARALVAARRAPEALALVAKIASEDANLDARTALLYEHLADLPGGAAPPIHAHAFAEKIAAQQSRYNADAWISSLAGRAVDLEKITSQDYRATVEIQLAIGVDPKSAWVQCAAAATPVLRRLDSTAALLLAAELGRAGDRDMADRILAGRLEYGFPPRALLAYALSGEEPVELWRLDPEWRAALDLVRARRLEETGKPAEQAYADAERRDILRTIVTRARKAWPPVRAVAPATTRKGAPRAKGGAAVGEASSAPPAAAGGEVVLKKEL